MVGFSTIFLFLLIIGVILVIGAFLLYRKGKNFSGKTLKNMFFACPFFRFWVLIPTLIFAGAFLYLYGGALSSTASIIITLNYDNASKGQNANGTRYNMSEIICDEVIERAIEKGALQNVSVNDLASCLYVMPTVQGSAADESMYHVTTEFLLTYLSSARTSHLDAENVVRLVADAYKEFYIENYADNFDSLNITIDAEEDFADTDYLDTAEWLKIQASVVGRYMEELAYENPSFLSDEGETFSSIASKVSNVSSVLIEDNLKAYLLQNGMSKDRDAYIGRLKYDNRLSDFAMQKADASFEIRNEAVKKYSEEMARIVLVPTWDEEGEYYMGRTKIGIDTLSMEAEGYSNSSAGYSKEIATNESVMQALRTGRGTGDEELVAYMVQEISAEIESLAQKASAAGQKYSETRMNGIISSTMVNASLSKTVVMTFAIGVLFYLAVNILASSVKFPKEKRFFS